MAQAAAAQGRTLSGIDEIGEVLQLVDLGAQGPAQAVAVVFAGAFGDSRVDAESDQLLRRSNALPMPPEKAADRHPREEGRGSQQRSRPAAPRPQLPDVLIRRRGSDRVSPQAVVRDRLPGFRCPPAAGRACGEVLFELFLATAGESAIEILRQIDGIDRLADACGGLAIEGLHQRRF